MRTHELKCWPEYLDAILSGAKTFDGRKHDRDFVIGDVVLLREWFPITQQYGRRRAERIITYILPGGQFGIAADYCVLGYTDAWKASAKERAEERILALEAENARLRRWVDDLQSGMYVNCVYCGHNYGPGETTPVSMAEALKAHVEQCSEHPMSALRAKLQETERALAKLRGTTTP